MNLKREDRASPEESQSQVKKHAPPQNEEEEDMRLLQDALCREAEAQADIATIKARMANRQAITKNQALQAMKASRGGN